MHLPRFINFSSSSFLTIAFAWLWGLTWLVYWGSLDNPFYFDDRVFILKNPVIQDFAEIMRGFGRLFSSGRSFPLLTFHFNYAIHGFEVTGYHIVNTCIHALNACLVFLLIRRLLPEENVSGWIPLGAASLFTVHPLMSSSVLYITQRSGLLAALFYLLAFISYLKMRDSTAPLHK
ncbi:MAG: hypothetical protein HQM14_20465 [SAR324 cluster bacterium]|nr:hypothetical protein [SAR324 cluster bacterium]